MNISISNSSSATSTSCSNAQQFLSTLSKLQQQQSTSATTTTTTSTTSSCSATNRVALSINQNIGNTSQHPSAAVQNTSMLLRNLQLSPNTKSKLNMLQQQNQQSNYPNYQQNTTNSQLNFLQQKQQNQQSVANSTSTLLAAATLLASTANNPSLASTLNSLYPQSTCSSSQSASSSQQQQQSCNLNNTLFVGNLHASLQEMDLIQVFRPFGRIVECCKKWLHFGFVKFTTEEEACHAYVTLNGFRLKGRPMRLEFQNRSKKARIKAILTSAGGQQQGTVNDSLLSMGNYESHLNIGGGQGSQRLMGGGSGGGNGYANFANLLDDRQNNFNSLFSNLHNTTNQYQNNSYNNNNNNTQYNNSLFNADQLLKFAQKSSELSIPEFNFDLVGGSAPPSSDLPSTSSSSNYFYDELDLKLDDHNSQSHFLNVNNDIVLSLIKNTISPVHESPNHDTSSSLSTDSGCRSNSFLNDEDSAICSVSTTTTQMTSSKVENKEISKKKLDDFCCNTISEHLEFTCSVNSSPLKGSEEKKGGGEETKEEKVSCLAEVKESEEIGEITENEELEDDDDDDDDENDVSSSDCDTSDDASDLPDEHLSSSSDCLQDLDLDFEDLEVEVEKKGSLLDEQEKYNQVMEENGTVLRKKLNSGIYKSVNQTLSLFIEPHDILKRMDMSEFNEYSLFPTTSTNVQCESVETDVDVLLKKHFYSVEW